MSVPLSSTRLRLLPLLIALGAGGLVTVAQAQSLSDLYSAARGYDATYQAAKQQSDATLAKAAQAQALLLPTVGLSMSANQINQEIKEELTGKLAEFASHTDNLEEIFENREQIEVSKYYERQPKPHAIAIQEFMDDRIYYRNPAKGSKSF